MSYTSTILTDSPLVYFPMNETSGTTAVDASGHGHDGVYHGSPTLNVGGTPFCDGGTGVTYDGVDDYCDVTLDLSGTNKVSIEWWGSLITLTGGGYWFDQGSGTDNFWALPDITTTYYRIGEMGDVSGAANANTEDYPMTIDDHTGWKFYGITIDRSQNAANAINLFYNGVRQTNGTNGISGSYDNTNNFANASVRIALGSHNPYNTQSYLNATIARFAMYTTILSAAQWNTHYTAGIDCNEPYWGVGG